MLSDKYNLSLLAVFPRPVWAIGHFRLAKQALLIIFVVVPCVLILSKSFLFSPTDALYTVYSRI